MKKNNEMDIDSVENPFNTGDTIMQKYGWVMNEPQLEEWSDSAKFLIAPEIKEIGTQVIKSFRTDLNGCNIGYVFKKKAPKTPNGVILGQIKAENELQKILHGYDAIVLIGYDTWVNLDDDGKFRLVMHELEHLVRDINTGRIGTISHDVEEFSSVIRIFGPNQTSHISFIEGYQRFSKEHGSKE